MREGGVLIAIVEPSNYYTIDTHNEKHNMNIKIIKSELHTTAKQDLETDQDMLVEDRSLAETLEEYEQKTTEET